MKDWVAFYKRLPVHLLKGTSGERKTVRTLQRCNDSACGTGEQKIPRELVMSSKHFGNFASLFK
jgi:hypothetical protein